MDERRDLRNGLYGAAEFVAVPLLQLGTTRFLVGKLGYEAYGVWMLANAAAGSLGAVTLGLGDATVHYVAKHMAVGDREGASRAARATLTLYGGLNAALATAVIAAASPLGALVTKDPSGATALRLAAIAWVVKSIESVFVSTLRGCHRYDLASPTSIATKLAVALGAVVAAALGAGVPGILTTTIALTSAGAAAQAAACARVLGRLPAWPIWKRVELARILGFGMYGWLQGIGGVLLFQGDRVIVGALLGPETLTVYSVCAQAAQQIHALAASAFNFVLPAIADRDQRRGPDLVTFYRRALAASAILAIAAALPMALGSKVLLRVWMGAPFAHEGSDLLAVLAVSHAVLAIAVVPQYALLGLGRARSVAIANLVSGGLSLAATALLVPFLGPNAAGLGRLVYGAGLAIAFAKVSRALDA